MVETLASIFAFLLGVVTVSFFGHLIWTALRGLFRAALGWTCPKCGRVLDGKGDCARCRAASASNERVDVQTDIASARRLLQLARSQAWLSIEELQTIERCFQRLNERVAGNRQTKVQPISIDSNADLATTTRGPAATENIGIVEAEILQADILDSSFSPSATEFRPEPATAINAPTYSAPVHPLDEPDEPVSASTAITGAGLTGAGLGSTIPGSKGRVQTISADILRPFMERSNIRWVELISAALVVVCSVGLVISLWSTLSRTSRFFPSLVFMVATLAVHGAGQYTLRRWKLRTTSRGILQIGMMLIPLSVLVGILLSRRAELLELNVTSGAVLAFGGLVYSALAVTAARALFSSRGWLIALATIVTSFTLVAVDTLAARSVQPLIAAATLLPLVALTAVVAMIQSLVCVRRRQWTVAFSRRHLGMITQAIFAAATAGIFSYLRFQSADLLSSWWWAAIGMLAVSWAGWGWAAGFSRVSQPQQRANQLRANHPTTIEASWFTVVGWVVGLVASLLLVACLWQMADLRLSLIGLLVFATLWWFIQGLLCRLNVSMVVSGIALVIAVALGGEMLQLGDRPLKTVDWVSFPRVSWLAGGGIAIFILGTVFSWSRSSRQPLPWNRFVGHYYSMAGGVCLLAAVGLTLLASVGPWGETPYGGQWAAMTLAIYGTLITAAGIALQWPSANGMLRSDQPLADDRLPRLPTYHWVVPLGQAISIFASIRLCQTSHYLPEWMEILQPIRACAVALTGLAVAWGLVALVLSYVGFRTYGDYRGIGRWLAIDWLCGVACVLVAVSLPALWQWGDRFELAGRLGWSAPLVAFCVWIAWRSVVARELLLITLCGWCWCLLFRLGDQQDWWSWLGLSASVAVHAVVGAVLVALFVGTMSVAGRRRYPAWFASQPYFSAPGIIVVCLLGLLCSVALPAGLHIGRAMGLDLPMRPMTLAFQSPNTSGLLVVLTAIFALMTTVVVASQRLGTAWLRALVAASPLLCGITLAAWAASSWSLVWLLWTLGLSLVASEGLAWFGRKWSEQSTEAWSQLLQSNAGCDRDFHWLYLGRSITAFGLLIVTALVVFRGWQGMLAPELFTSIESVAGADRLVAGNGSAFGDWSKMFVLIGPLLLFASTRWLLCVIEDAGTRQSTVMAAMAAMAFAVIASFGVIDSTDRAAIVSVQLLQTLATSLAVFSAMSIGLPFGRNFLALRAIDQGKSPWLLLVPKARKGGRWKRAESTGWSLIVYAFLSLTLLSILATVANVWSPVEELPLTQAIAAWPSLLAYVLVIIVFMVIGRLRSISRFGLLAISLGLAAPLFATMVSNWLAADSSRWSATDGGFEAIRAQVVLWLAALAVGLIVRLSASGQKLNRSGEALWIGLAALVGCLILISTTGDPKSVWPRSEMITLALIVVMSGLAANQRWRGHIAAVAAAIGMISWQAEFDLNSLWKLFWGPVWIGLIAVTWTLIAQRFRRSSDAAMRGPAVPSPDMPGPTQLDADMPRMLDRGAEAIDLPSSGLSRFEWLPSVDQSVSVHVPVVICLLSGFSLLARGMSANELNLVVVIGLGLATFALALARLWDYRPGKRGLALYVASLSSALIAALAINQIYDLMFQASCLIWLAAGLSAMAVMAGCVREWIRESSQIVPTLRLGAIDGRQEAFIAARRWIVPLHCIIGLFLIAPCFWLIMNSSDRGLRLATAALPLISALSILPIAIEPLRRIPRVIGLLLLACAIVLIGWGDLERFGTVPSSALSWSYVERSFVSLILMGWAFGWLAEPLRKKIDWQTLLHRAGWIAIVLGSFCGTAMVIGAFAGPWRPSAAATELSSKVLTILCWIALLTRLMQLAIAPRGLDSRATIATRRTAVYAAEIGLALMAAAIYYSFPEYFSGLVARWWPILVFAIAMISAGIGHWCERIGQTVISDPVRRSSLLLPLIPLLGVWWPNADQVGIDWADWQRYSLLLITAAALYGMHSYIRPSMGLKLLAAFLTLLSFWSLLHSQPDLRFFAHPQFWLLPPAVASLVFVEWNRQRLHASVVVAARYLSILVAYLSSTADMFLQAFEGQLWQPLLLLVLAVAGVLAGIALRVRAFLFTGSAFVMVALLGMVWHAQQAIDQVWPWWAFGILTGVGLIVALGYFEKNRPRVIAYLEQFKDWN